MANEDKKDFNAMLHDNKDMPKFQIITDQKSIEKYGVHFTGLSGRHSVLERPLYEVNGRPFFSQKTTA